MWLDKIIPSTGEICIALQKPWGFQHVWVLRENLEAWIKQYADNGETVFLAQATFATQENRKQKNAVSLRSFFLDIDCGGAKDPYVDQKAGCAALIKFYQDAGLPQPAVINSGNGLYAYWFMDRDVEATAWKQTALLLKDVLVAYEFKYDYKRTADSASVLRPLGSIHRKDVNNPKEVKLIIDADPANFDEFLSLLTKAARKKQINVSRVQAPKLSAELLSEFEAGLGEHHKESDIEVVADRCRQIGKVRETLGNVGEPLWYNFIGLARHTTRGREVIHEWSQGHDDYTVEFTDKKIEQHEAGGIGPTTCWMFGSTDPELCLGCKLKNKVKSPIVLGHPAPEAAAPISTVVAEAHEPGMMLGGAEWAGAPEELLGDTGAVSMSDDEVPEPPSPYFRAADGLYTNDEEGTPQRFYAYDLFPIDISYDEALEYEVTTVRHKLPFEGWREFQFRSAILMDPKQFSQVLWDNHVKVVSKTEQKLMTDYMAQFTRKLQGQKRIKKLRGQMGWKLTGQTPAFLLGDRLLEYNGNTTKVGLSRNVPECAQSIASVGDRDKWVGATEILGRRGNEAHAFTLLAGAFGAPLMKFTGYDGALVSTVGESGTGKSLMSFWVMSAYGKYKDLLLLKDDTYNALVSRLGFYGNLPLTIDEMTNAEPEDISDLAYRITQGRDKLRLTRGATERKGVTTWNTLAIVNTNFSLVSKLSQCKADASAEINRVFEYPIRRVDSFSQAEMTECHNIFAENYGHVGEEYLKFIIKTFFDQGGEQRHRDNIRKLTLEIERRAGSVAGERFWSAVVAATIYGGYMAKQAGLIKFNIEPIMDWAVLTIKSMRNTKVDNTSEAVDILSQFFNKHLSSRCIMRSEDSHYMLPMGKITHRYNLHTDTMLVDFATFKDFIRPLKLDFLALRTNLKDLGVIVKDNLRRNLAAGTDGSGGQTRCIEIDMNNPNIGHTKLGLQAVLEEERLKREEIEGGTE